MGFHFPGKVLDLIAQQGDLLGQESLLRFIIGQLNGDMDQNKKSHHVKKEKKGRGAIFDTQPVGYLIHNGMKKRQAKEDSGDADP
jgi:hypothetical protein